MRAWIVQALAMLVLAALGAPAAAQGAQARLLAAYSDISATRDTIRLELQLSQPVPYRLRLLALPPRLVLDANTIDFAEARDMVIGPGVRALRHGSLPNGWSRLVLDMEGPFLPVLDTQDVDPVTGQARIRLYLERAEMDAFEARVTPEAQFLLRAPATFLHPDATPPPAPQPRLRPVVMLDPGHGGIDPGAERDGVRESDLVLAFARLLREEILRRGNLDVAMTRDADEFVSLDGRIRAARAVDANLFLSLHADALPQGQASGTIVYLLDEDASDEAAAYLAERHDRADLLAGVDLARNTDEIARVLMSIAWQDTAPRARALAETLVETIGAEGLRLHRRPVQAGAFSVLRAPDMPSVLIELGFMSSPRDLANLRDPDWQARMARALAQGLEDWVLSDAALEDLRQQ